jgi:oligopeptidase A
VTHLRAKLRGGTADGDAALDEAQAAAKSLLRDIDMDHAQLMERLGVSTARTRAAAAFYTLVSTTDSATTRSKLSRAWRQIRDRRLEPLLDTVDRMIELRRQDSAERGYPSVLAQTLERSRVTEPTAQAYLDRYLRQALDSHAGLDADIRAALGDVEGPTDHFGYYVRTLVDGVPVPLFSLDACLDFIFTVARRVFGLTISPAPDRSPHVRAVDVQLDGVPCGQINFDLWDIGPRRRTANHTTGMRNRTDMAGVVQRPVAYVSCRFQRDDDHTNRITFQNVHSLFHEFGHAVNHLLIRKRLPNQSGLEYLPLERLEDLSMWFEKWVYHPGFADSLGLSDEDSVGLALCQRVKMLEYRRTHVDRAVTAALDFAVHRDPKIRVREAFEHLDEAYAVSRFCTLGDFPAYFTWPMFQANPGANFAYLWGSAESAGRFAPFLTRPITATADPAELRRSFSACFDFDEPSVQPDVRDAFAFYDAPWGARA